MDRHELIQQLEFLRDIGIDRLEMCQRPDGLAPRKSAEAVASAPVEVPVSPQRLAVTNVPAVKVSPEFADAAPPDFGLPPDPPEYIPDHEPEFDVATPLIAAAPSGLAEDLPAIRADLGDCQRCKLAPSRKHIVFGSGNPQAEVVFVGEAPGRDEDLQGLPFVGEAGQLLTKIIESIGIQRDEVYICNILKCRPPQNRNPEPDEVLECSPFLKRQIAAIRPKIVCCLGKFAAQTLLQSPAPITKLRGEFHDIEGMRVIATFHPAYLLRSPEKKREVWEDMKQIRAELFRLRS